MKEDSARGVSEMPSPTMRELATVLFRQRRVFLGTAGLVLLLTLLYTILGDRYEAHMKVLVRRGRADAPVTAQENAPIDMTRLIEFQVRPQLSKLFRRATSST